MITLLLPLLLCGPLWADDDQQDGKSPFAPPVIDVQVEDDPIDARELSPDGRADLDPDAAAAADLSPGAWGTLAIGGGVSLGALAMLLRRVEMWLPLLQLVGLRRREDGEKDPEADILTAMRTLHEEQMREQRQQHEKLMKRLDEKQTRALQMIMEGQQARLEDLTRHAGAEREKLARWLEGEKHATNTARVSVELSKMTVLQEQLIRELRRSQS
ncbi:MAG: hypothetical protein AAFV53_19930 [Myxococcota bacterium]